MRLVQLMEQRPDVGMIQTAPAAVNRRSLFARVQQFSSHVYGPMFTAGLHFWQLGDGQYWGHNTIIRVAPFMEHCALPKLPGKPPLGGEILSHDFVEAALMGRAGWTLWLAYDLGGSYGGSAVDAARGDGARSPLVPGQPAAPAPAVQRGPLRRAPRPLRQRRALLRLGAALVHASSCSAPSRRSSRSMRVPDYFPHGPSLFPEWPVWRPDWALALLSVTGIILFLPKVLSILLLVFHNRASRARTAAPRASP